MVLVAGGASYIGSHVVKRLLEWVRDTIVFDNLQTGHREAIIGGMFIRGDMGDERVLQRIFTNHAGKLEEIIDSAWHWHRTHPHGFSLGR